MNPFEHSGGPPAPGWSVGQRVLARWHPEVYSYPGTIAALFGERYQVNFDDGDRALVTGDDLAPLDVTVGSRVFGRWRGGNLYYPGVVVQQSGENIYIQYDDGDEEWSLIGLVRVERE